MKTIHCIISPHQLNDICCALVRAGVTDFAVTDAREFICRKNTEQPLGSGEDDAIELWPQAKIEVMVTDDLIDHLLQTMLRAAATDQAGDGMIFVSETTQAV